MKNPPSYARVARMSGAELVAQLDLPTMAPDYPPRCTVRTLVVAEIKLRLEGKRQKRP